MRIAQEGGVGMIHQDKVKVMAKLALYEKKKGRKDFRIYSYEDRDYTRAQGLKTAILVTIAFVILVGLIVLDNIEMIVERFDTLNYALLIAVGIAAYLLILVGYLVLSYKQSKRETIEMGPRVREYAEELEQMEEFYEEEEEQRRKFEKGQWQNGQ